jgi:hypothetical protein
MKENKNHIYKFSEETSQETTTWKAGKEIGG